MQSRWVGSGVLHHYKGSLSAALEAVYPNVEWHPWLFERARKRYWKDPYNIKKFMLWMANKLGITKEEEWLRVSAQTFIAYGGIIFYYP